MTEKSGALGDFTILSVNKDKSGFVAYTDGGRFFSVELRGGDLLKIEGDVETLVFKGTADITPTVFANLIKSAKNGSPAKSALPFNSAKASRIAVLAATAIVVIGASLYLAVPGKAPQTPAAAPAVATPSVEEQNAANGPVPITEALVVQASPTVEMPTTVNVRPNIDISANGAEEPLPTALTPATPVEAAPVAAAGPSANPLEIKSQQAVEAMNEVQSEAREIVNSVGADEAQKSLATLEQVLAALNANGKVTPEMAAKLPHEVAEQLRQAGAIQTLEEAAAVADDPAIKVVRLPVGVVDKYRDADGIASIPEANSWITTGGYVRVPLPGGGDINRPEDIERFGLTP